MLTDDPSASPCGTPHSTGSDGSAKIQPFAEPPAMVEFFLNGAAVSALPDESVLAACQRSGVALATVCKGRGICGACRVSVEAGLDALPEPSTNEIRLLGYLARGEDARTHRLACQIILTELLSGLRLNAYPVAPKS
jgi:ferredoxin